MNTAKATEYIEKAFVAEIETYENVISSFISGVLEAGESPVPGVIMETAINMIRTNSKRGRVLDKLIYILDSCSVKYTNALARKYVQTEITNALVSVGFSKLVLQPGIQFKMSSGDLFSASKLINAYAPNIKALDKAAHLVIHNCPILSLLSSDVVLFMVCYGAVYDIVPDALEPLIIDMLFTYCNIDNMAAIMATFATHATHLYCSVAHALAPNIERLEREKPALSLSAWVAVQYIRNTLINLDSSVDNIAATFHLLIENEALRRSVITKMLGWVANPANIEDRLINKAIGAIAVKNGIKY